MAVPPLGEILEAAEEEAEPDDAGQELDLSDLIQAHHFTLPKRAVPDLLIAVDSGVVTLGQMTGGGIAFAVRGAAACSGDGTVLVLRYNTGALLITPGNKAAIFRYIGQRLGTPDLYVWDTPSGLVPKPNMVDTANQISDRCRNFVERMIQE